MPEETTKKVSLEAFMFSATQRFDDCVMSMSRIFQDLGNLIEEQSKKIESQKKAE